MDCKACDKGAAKCPTCKGTGRIIGFISNNECKNCSGSGIVKCGVCKGTGKI